MSFTDEDLKRLKEMLEPGIKGHPDTLMREVEEFLRFKADALIARLETAEKVAEATARHRPNDPDVFAWHKAAGK